MEADLHLIAVALTRISYLLVFLIVVIAMKDCSGHRAIESLRTTIVELKNVLINRLSGGTWT